MGGPDQSAAVQAADGTIQALLHHGIHEKIILYRHIFGGCYDDVRTVIIHKAVVFDQNIPVSSLRPVQRDVAAGETVNIHRSGKLKEIRPVYITKHIVAYCQVFDVRTFAEAVKFRHCINRSAENILKQAVLDSPRAPDQTTAPPLVPDCAAANGETIAAAAEIHGIVSRLNRRFPVKGQPVEFLLARAGVGDAAVFINFPGLPVIPETFDGDDSGAAGFLQVEVEETDFISGCTSEMGNRGDR